MPEILFKFDKFRVLTEHLFLVIFMMFAILAFQIKLSICVSLYSASNCDAHFHGDCSALDNVVLVSKSSHSVSKMQGNTIQQQRTKIRQKSFLPNVVPP